MNVIESICMAVMAVSFVGAAACVAALAGRDER